MRVLCTSPLPPPTNLAGAVARAGPQINGRAAPHPAHLWKRIQRVSEKNVEHTHENEQHETKSYTLAGEWLMTSILYLVDWDVSYGYTSGSSSVE